MKKQYSGLSTSAAATTPPRETPLWDDPHRQQAFEHWLAQLEKPQGLIVAGLRVASADASFRRYFRVDTDRDERRIVMDAPTEHEDSAPFVKIAMLMEQAGIRAPQILDWDQTHGFMLMSDLGTHTMLQTMDMEDAAANQARYLEAVDILLAWQQASRPAVLPPYDDALLRRELQLFPDWYLARHRGMTLNNARRQTLNETFDQIVTRNLAAPMVYVHRDFMPRNLMVPDEGGALGLIDFQDAVFGPITYDIASLMRDAFVSWDEEFVLDITVRYWERAKKLGLMDHEDWATDFGSFWRAVEWMGLQRHLKVAGIFARLGLRDGKPKYLADTPRFMAYIRQTASRYRELTPLLRLIDEVEGAEQPETWVMGR